MYIRTLVYTLIYLCTYTNIYIRTHVYTLIYVCICIGVCESIRRVYIWIAEVLYLINDLTLTPGPETVLQGRN